MGSGWAHSKDRPCADHYRRPVIWRERSGGGKIDDVIVYALLDRQQESV